MESFYVYCAVIGGAIFVVQLLLSFAGIDGMDELELPDGDVDFDADLGHQDGWFVGIISFRSLVAAFTVFGLTGLSLKEVVSPAQSLVFSTLAGAAVLYAVGWTFKQLSRLHSDGAVRIERAIGCSGTVYLKIPAANSSAGKITIEVQGRTMEYQAMTAGDELPGGTPIVVTAVLSPETVEVESLTTHQAAATSESTSNDQGVSHA